eukprot:m.27679 g.27679  ORF g.27679 m.27679 type:complete len:172 (+) comp9393_c0_seq3:67-582(+)
MFLFVFFCCFYYIGIIISPMCLFANTIPSLTPFSMYEMNRVHSWGDTLEESFEQAVVAMFGYMTELDKVEEDESKMEEFEVTGKDLPELLFNLLDEFLFRFSAENFLICKRVEIVALKEAKDGCSITVRGYGETFDLAKHPQGTEIKAITYSNMQIHNDKPTHDVYVILDI